MKKILFFFLLSLTICISAQPSKPGLNQMKGIFFDTFVIPSAKNADCYITYQATYNRLVFVKDKDVFTSSFSLSLEAVDSLTGRVFREIVNYEHSVKDFEETNSDTRYFQGVIKLLLPPGSYKVLPSIYDNNTNSEHLLSPFSLKVNSPESKWVLSPIVVKDLVSKKDVHSKVLAGFDGNVPFSQEAYDMVIPVLDTNISSIYVEFKNNDSLIYKDSLKNSFVSSLSFSQNQENIAANYTSQGTLTRNFVIPKFNVKLMEGTLSISIKKDAKEKVVFRRSVIWFNKPRSLGSPEYAIKVLKNIAGEAELLQLAKSTGIEAYNRLNSYWQKFDPTPGTAYNELMAEFYERVDYAVNSFSLLTNPDGAETDRGRVYIKFGKPKSVERIYQDSKNVREVWKYDSPENRQFIFVDKSGLGNFILSGRL